MAVVGYFPGVTGVVTISKQHRVQDHRKVNLLVGQIPPKDSLGTDSRVK